MGAAVRKKQKPSWWKFSPIKNRVIIYPEELSARGRQKIGGSGGETPDIPVYKSTVRPRNPREIILDDARHHRSENERLVNRELMKFNCELAVFQYLSRRNVYQAQEKSAGLAPMIVTEALFPAVKHSPAELCVALNIHPQTYRRKRESGPSWKEMVDHIRSNWLDCFKREKPL